MQPFTFIIHYFNMPRPVNTNSGPGTGKYKLRNAVAKYKNIRKPLVYCCLQRDQKGTLERKGLMKKFDFSVAILCQIVYIMHSISFAHYFNVAEKFSILIYYYNSFLSNCTAFDIVFEGINETFASINYFPLIIVLIS